MKLFAHSPTKRELIIAAISGAVFGVIGYYTTATIHKAMNEAGL